MDSDHSSDEAAEQENEDAHRADGEGGGQVGAEAGAQEEGESVEETADPGQAEQANASSTQLDSVDEEGDTHAADSTTQRADEEEQTNNSMQADNSMQVDSGDVDESDTSTSPAQSSVTADSDAGVSTYYEAVFKLHIGREEWPVGTVTMLPAPLLELLPGTNKHFYTLHAHSSVNKGWGAPWFALALDRALRRQSKTRFIAGGRADGWACAVQLGARCDEKASSLREGLQRVFIGKSEDAVKSQKIARTRWQQAQSTGTSPLSKFTLKQLYNRDDGDDHRMLDLSCLWLLSAHHPKQPYNVIVLDEELSVYIKSPSAADIDAVRSGAVPAVDPHGNSAHTLRIIVLSPSGELDFKHLKHPVDTIVIHQYQGGLYVQDKAAPDIYTSVMVATRFSVLIDDHLRVRWHHTHQGIKFLLEQQPRYKSHAVTATLLQDRAEQRQAVQVAVVSDDEHQQPKAAPAASRTPSTKKTHTLAGGRTVKRKAEATADREEDSDDLHQSRATSGVAAQAKKKRGGGSGLAKATTAANSQQRQSTKSAGPSAAERSLGHDDTRLNRSEWQAGPESGPEVGPQAGPHAGSRVDSRLRLHVAEEGVEAATGEAGNCGHFETCRAGLPAGSTKCSKWHTDRADHDKSTHPSCCLDVYTKLCPALDRRRDADRGTFKFIIMAGDSKTKWNPQPPPSPDNATMTAWQKMVSPVPNKSATEADKAAVQAAMARLWEKVSSSMQAGEHTQPVTGRHSSPHYPLSRSATPPAAPHIFNPADVMMAGQAQFSASSSQYWPTSSGSDWDTIPGRMSGPTPSYMSGQAWAPAPIPSSALFSASQSSQSSPPQGSTMTAGRVEVLEAWQFWKKMPGEVAPILFHTPVSDHFAGDEREDHVVLWRPNQCLLSNSLAAHLRPTKPDVIFPLNTHPDLYHYWRTPLSIIHINSALPSASGTNSDDRIKLAVPTKRTQQDRERQFSDSLQTNAYAVQAARPTPYRKDNTESVWPMHSTPNMYGKSLTTPTFTQSELDQWLSSVSEHDRNVMSAKVMMRAIEHDDRINEMVDENDYRLVIGKMEAYLDGPNMKIFDIIADDERRSKRKSTREKRGGSKSASEANVSAQPLTVELNQQRWASVAALHTANPFNLARTPHHPQSLSSLLPNHGLDYIGGMTAMLYIKHEAGGDFPLHVEQGFMPFVNLCHDGVGIWWSISSSHEDKLIQYANDAARQHHLWEDDFNLCNAQHGCSKVLLYARCLMPDPLELVDRYHIPVQRFEQQAGDVMIGYGYTYHMGTAATSTVVNEAINAVPVWWLKRGLPQLLAMLKNEMTPYWRAKKAFDEQDRETPPDGFSLKAARLLFHDTVADDFYRLMPVNWFRNFVRVILFHLRAHMNDPQPAAAADAERLLFKPDKPGMEFKGMAGSELRDAQKQLQELCAWCDSEAALAIEERQARAVK